MNNKVRNEFLRKFLIKELPDLSKIKPVRYESYFLLSDDELRVSVVNKMCRLERKTQISDLERIIENKIVTEQEAKELLKGNHTEVILYDKYFFSVNPPVVIKIYQGRFTGLNKAEVEFLTEEEAKSFTAPEWMGEEVTAMPISRDNYLTELSDQEFKSYI